jgi:hypothetical protein
MPAAIRVVATRAEVHLPQGNGQGCNYGCFF